MNFANERDAKDFDIWIKRDDERKRQERKMEKAAQEMFDETEDIVIEELRRFFPQ
jgi:hypothetical protein|tara:strand:- start:126 stop:290 length:165 start_codon:yes stop_codon:yes gene_type:complete